MSATDRRPAVVFHCYGGTHSSVVAAAVRCGILSAVQAPRRFDALPWFDRIPPDVAGQPVLIGQDRQGYRVFALGRRSLGSWMHTRLPFILGAVGVQTPLLVDAGRATTLLMKAGGLLSRRFHIIGPGRVLLEAGTRQAWQSLRELACRPLRMDCSRPPPPRTLVIASVRGKVSLRYTRSSSLRVLVVPIGTAAPIAVTVLRTILGLSEGAERLAVVTEWDAAGTTRIDTEALWHRWRCPVH